VIGLDTNIIIRYLAQDDAKQSAAATRLLESLTTQSPGFITSVVLAEVIWVMEDLYGADRTQIGDIVESLLQTGSLAVQNPEITWQALSAYRTGSADFSDFLVERTCHAFGCSETYTFDKKAARKLGGMILLS